VHWRSQLRLFFATAPPSVQVKSDANAFALQRLDILWLVTYIDDAGREVIAHAPAASGELVPLMAADGERLQSKAPSRLAR